MAGRRRSWHAGPVDSPHRQPLTHVVRSIALRAVGTWVVTAVLFATFVSSRQADTHPLTTGSWLLAVALSGLFCAAWVARDTPHFARLGLVRTWGLAVVVVVLALTASALLTDTERSRTAGADLGSALSTSLLIGVGLALSCVIGYLVGRAASQTPRD